MTSRAFDVDDQVKFAKLSGDFNPLHVDPLTARRSLYGSVVVHGVHGVLWALDCSLRDNKDQLEIQSVSAVFAKPIRLHDAVHLTVTREAGRQRLELRCRGEVATRVDIVLDRLGGPSPGGFKNQFPRERLPQDLTPDEVNQYSGTLDLCLSKEAAEGMFPHLLRSVPARQVAVVLSLTQMVGMICPGLHSVFSELHLTSDNTPRENELSHTVTKFDRRFNLVHTSFQAPKMSGTVAAFLRPLPQDQPSFVSAKSFVEGREFSDQRAIVVGGSRGLGEVAAKLLAAGGGKVRLTFQMGRDDAARIARDITDNGGTTEACHFDVLNPAACLSNRSQTGWQATHVYYFATPFIFQGVTGVFSPELFRKFCDYYVAGFVNVVDAVRSDALRGIFYPSTVAIDEAPSSMSEYAAAKNAGESVCRFLAKSHPAATVFSPRLPRVATDQTASVMPVENQDPTPLMLELLRTFREQCQSKNAVARSAQ